MPIFMPKEEKFINLACHNDIIAQIYMS